MPGACGVAGGTDASGVAEGSDAAESGDDASETGAVSDADVGESGAEGGGAIGAEAGGCMPTPKCDDLQLAMTGIKGQLWVTRLRADLPASALATDLVLEATQSQTPVSNLHQTSKYTVPGYSPCPNGSCASASAASRSRYADATVFALGAMGFALTLRRMRRRRRH
jgi:hypothetical protein